MFRREPRWHKSSSAELALLSCRTSEHDRDSDPFCAKRGRCLFETFGRLQQDSLSLGFYSVDLIEMAKTAGELSGLVFVCAVSADQIVRLIHGRLNLSALGAEVPNLKLVRCFRSSVKALPFQVPR